MMIRTPINYYNEHDSLWFSCLNVDRLDVGTIAVVVGILPDRLLQLAGRVHDPVGHVVQSVPERSVHDHRLLDDPLRRERGT